MSVSVPTDLVKSQLRAAAGRYAARMKTPGFRRGRVPAGMVLNRFGNEIQDFAFESTVKLATEAAIKANGLRPVSKVDVTELRRGEDESLTFTASFDTEPDVRLGRTGGFRVERPASSVPQGAVDAALERVRARHARWRETAEGPPQDGDRVNLVLALDGKPRSYEIVLGQGEALPDIEDAVRTLDPGGHGHFHVRFPDEFPEPDRRGRRERMRVELLSRSIRELPDPDDDFARAVGGFDTLEELKQDIRKSLEAEAAGAARAQLLDRLVREVVEANPFEPPDSLVDGYVDSLISDATDIDDDKLEELRASLRPAAALAVRRDYVLDKIVEEHDLAARDREVREFVAALARDGGQSPRKLYARLRKNGGLADIRNTITSGRLGRFLESRSEITDPE